MSSIQFTGDVLPDGSIRPPVDVRLKPGRAEVTVVQRDTSEPGRKSRRSLAEWAEQHAENWGGRLSSADVSTFTGRSD